jgi:hypothetical protein
MPLKPVYDRALLLLGPKRNKELTLEEMRRYGIDSFSDPDYVQIYGMAPAHMVQARHPAARPNSGRPTTRRLPIVSHRVPPVG